MVDQSIITVLVGALVGFVAFTVTRWYDKWKYEQSQLIDATYRQIEEGDRSLQTQIDRVVEILNRRVDEVDAALDRVDEVIAKSQPCSCGCAKA